MEVHLSVCFISVVCFGAWRNPETLSPIVHLFVHLSSICNEFIYILYLKCINFSNPRHHVRYLMWPSGWNGDPCLQTKQECMYFSSNSFHQNLVAGWAHLSLSTQSFCRLSYTLLRRISTQIFFRTLPPIPCFFTDTSDRNSHVPQDHVWW